MLRERLHMDSPRHAATQTNARAVDGNQQRPAKRAAAVQRQDITYVDAETIQLPLQPVAAIDFRHAGPVAGLELDQPHDAIMIMILILKTSRACPPRPRTDRGDSHAPPITRQDQ